MIDIDFSLFWSNFISELIAVQKGEINIKDKVKGYHPIVQFSLCRLGWNPGVDLFHHYSLGRKKEKPDFFITHKGGRGIPIEVKLPSDVMNKSYTEQLIEYMRLSDSNIGIYIGEHIRVFYRPSIEDELKIVIDAALLKSDIEGLAFAELFFKPQFNIESLKSELNKYYMLEKLIDDYDFVENEKKLIPREWIVDRYNKRALLQTSNYKI